MSTGELIVVAVAIFGASIVQILAGFGFALLAMPVMTLAIPVEQGVVVVSLLALLSTSWQSIHLRRDAVPTLVARLVVASMIGMPLGLVILNVVDDSVLRILLGVAVLIATLLLARGLNLAHAGPSLEAGCGFVSGVLNTSLGTNGPPLVFVLQARQLMPNQFRATIAAVFVFSNVFALVLFLYDGKIAGDEIQAAVVALPAWAAGQLLGWPARRHVDGDRFRRLVLGLLLAAGLTAIIAAVR